MIRIGHRGAAAYAPENTLVSVRRAIEIGVDFVEIDVQSTSDGVVVLMHDKRIDRTTNGTGYVKELSWRELAAFRDAKSGPAIPRLEDVLEEARDRTQLMIELI